MVKSGSFTEFHAHQSKVCLLLSLAFEITGCLSVFGSQILTSCFIEKVTACETIEILLVTGSHRKLVM